MKENNSDVFENAREIFSFVFLNFKQNKYFIGFIEVKVTADTPIN